MRRSVVVALLEAVELLAVVQVVPPDDNCVFHLAGDHHALCDITTDADVPSIRALLVDVAALFRLRGGLEGEADVATQASLVSGPLPPPPLSEAARRSCALATNY